MNPKRQGGQKARNYMTYASMAYQILGILGVMIFLGQYLDNKFELEQSYFTAFLAILGLIAYFIKLYYELQKR